MIRKVTSDKLAYYISKRGPYVLYFNGECGGQNSEILKFMAEKANRYPIISFIEVKWSEYKMFKCKTDDYEMNNIYLYYDGMIKFCEPNPDSFNLEIFFVKVFELHNISIDVSLKNIGRVSNENRMILIKSDLLDFPPKRKNIFKYKETALLKKKIKLITENTCCKNNKNHTEYYNWYNEIKFEDLPNDLLENSKTTEKNTVKNKPIKNIIKNKYIKEISKYIEIKTKGDSSNNCKKILNTPSVEYTKHFNEARSCDTDKKHNDCKKLSTSKKQSSQVNLDQSKNIIKPIFKNQNKYSLPAKFSYEDNLISNSMINNSEIYKNKKYFIMSRPKITAKNIHYFETLGSLLEKDKRQIKGKSDNEKLCKILQISDS